MSDELEQLLARMDKERFDHLAYKHAVVRGKTLIEAIKIGLGDTKLTRKACELPTERASK